MCECICGHVYVCVLYLSMIECVCVCVCVCVSLSLSECVFVKYKVTKVLTLLKSLGMAQIKDSRFGLVD